MERNNNQYECSIKIMQSFWNVQKQIMHSFKMTASNNGLSIPMFVVLMTVAYRGESIMQKKVQEITSFPKSTLSQAIDGLVQEGFMHRQQVEGNRREIQLSVSQKGKELIQNLPLQENSIHQKFHLAVEKFSDEQLHDLLEMHSQIASHFNKERSHSEC